jgi:rSAM/selenodomain-associated transferase 2/rSAM/selenodomain-associated transferase 1
VVDDPAQMPMKPVIIVYAKAPVPGQVKTRLIPKLGESGATKLHEAFVEDTLAMVNTLADTFDIELHTDVPTKSWPWPGVRRVQREGNLGIKLYTTLHAALDGGRPLALIIGSDSPTLPTEFLEYLARSNADVVLGPAKDGGFYAIGCRKTHPDMFARVTWSNVNTRTQTKEAVGRCGLEVAEGREWFDVDEPEDLDLLIQSEPVGRTLEVLKDFAVMPRSPWLSIVIPTLNEAASIGRTLETVLALGNGAQVIVADGQSDDETARIAREYPVTVLSSARGRGLQLRTGAERATGEVLWFLHADSIPPPDSHHQIREALRSPQIIGGNFDLLFGGDSSAARQLTRIYPHLRKLGLCYGDSGIFVRREVYLTAGGFRPYPIFEDLDLIKRIRRQGRFLHLKSQIVTSSRRFEGRSFGVTFAKWTAMQIMYWAGVHPDVLGRWYAPIRSRGSRAER